MVPVQCSSEFQAKDRSHPTSPDKLPIEIVWPFLKDRADTSRRKSINSHENFRL
jgi:hypothetical protein